MNDNAPSTNNGRNNVTASKPKSNDGSGRKLLVCVGGKVFGIRDVFAKEEGND